MLNKKGHGIKACKLQRLTFWTSFLQRPPSVKCSFIQIPFLIIHKNNGFNKTKMKRCKDDIIVKD